MEERDHNAERARGGSGLVEHKGTATRTVWVRCVPFSLSSRNACHARSDKRETSDTTRTLHSRVHDVVYGSVARRAGPTCLSETMIDVASLDRSRGQLLTS